MTREQLLDEIMTHMNCNEYQEDALYAYISGDTDEEPEDLEEVRIYWYSLNLKRLIDDEETSDIIIRLINIFSRKSEEHIISVLSGNADRYYIYKKSNVSGSFIMNEIIYNFYYKFNLSYSFQFLYDYIDEMYNNLNKYYPSTILYFTSKDLEEFSGEEKFVAALFMAEKIAHKSDNYETYINTMEVFLYKTLKTAFNNEKVRNIFKEYINDDESYEYYDKTEVFNHKIKLVVCKNLIFFISNLCYGTSKLINNLAKIIGTLFNVKYLISVMGNKSANLIDLFKKFKLPAEKYLRYYAFNFMNSNSYSIKNIEIFKLYIDRFYNDYIKTLDKLFDEEVAESLILLAVLLKNNMFNNEEKTKYINKAESFIFSAIFEMQMSRETYEMKGDKIDFNVLQNEDFHDEDLVFCKDNPGFDIDTEKAHIGAVYIMEHSIVARNFLRSDLNGVCMYSLRRVKLLDNLRIFMKDENRNIFEVLYDDLHFSMFTIAKIYIASDKDYNKEQFLEFAKKHADELLKGIETFDFDIQDMITYINIFYEKEQGFSYKYLMKAFEKRSKVLIDFVEDMLITRENESRGYVEELLNSKSKAASDAARRIINIWNNEKIEEELQHITTHEELCSYIDKLYTQNNEKNIAFPGDIIYENVRFADSEELMPQKLIKYYVSEYILLKELYVINICKKIFEFSNKHDFRRVIKSIYDIWIADGVKAKYKNIVLPFALTASEGQLLDIKNQIDFWADNSKPSLAAFAVQALCMNGSKVALLLTDTMAKKHKSSKVRGAAVDAINMFIKNLRITKEDFEDLIVPDFGFDKNREKIFDYGERKFKAVINDKLAITLFDSTGKEIKSLPRVSVKYNDNESMVAIAKDDLKLIKKQIKTIFESQKLRMTRAVMTGRKWSVQKWKEIFIQNPIMTYFATSLIWEELTEDEKLIKTFRYMEDGTFNTADEEEHELLDNSFIMLLHPADIDEEEIELWKQQLEDYEIIQPAEQLNIPVYKIDDSNENATEINDYSGKKIYGATFKSIANKLSLSIEYNSYGECAGCYYIDNASNIKMIINITPFYSGDYNIITELKDLVFYDDSENKNKIELGKIPLKLISFGIMTAETLALKEIKN